MKKFGIALLVLSLVLMLGASVALAGHKPSHTPKPGSGSPPSPAPTEPPSCNNGKGNAPQNKHCYPPGTTSTSTGGKNASFSTEAPERQSGITVGMASLVAVGALGALLVLRRRWVFRATRR